jgi:hypothetical protein
MPSYFINKSFIKQFDNITLYLEGYLTNKELEIIEKVSQIVDLKIISQDTKFNQKMIDKIRNSPIKYELKDSNNINSKIEVANFSNSLYQVAFVFKKIEEFVQKDNFDPEKIAIIVPDESFASKLKIFDKFNNLNFAMGFSFVNTYFYKKLDTVYKLLIMKDKQLQKRKIEYQLETIFELIKNNNKIPLELFVEIYYLLIDEETSQAERKIIDEVIFQISKYQEFLKEYNLVEILYFALLLLSKNSIDDANSGKVKVMGVLESRAIKFEAVIIVDFNENIVPKPSQKDIFLNTSIKKLSNLPTPKDREDLQKYYYFRLMQNSKKVALSYVENGQIVPSRFLKELEIQTVENQDILYSKILFEKQKEFTHFEQEFEIDFDYRTQLLSASQLKIFLECKYKYYLRFIKKLKNHDTEHSLALQLGNEFHNAFYEVLDSSIYDKNIIKKQLKEFTDNKMETSSNKFDFDKFFYQIEPFLNQELKRYKDGFKIFAKELAIEFKFEDISFISRIDRVDEKNGKYYVIDYKTSKNVNIPQIKDSSKFTDFQLPLYAQAIKSINKEFAGAFLYDIRLGKLLEDDNINRKIELLQEKLKTFKEPKLHIYKCEDTKTCEYCEYKIICNR